jgi:hypothetical protein
MELHLMVLGNKKAGYYLYTAMVANMISPCTGQYAARILLVE